MQFFGLFSGIAFWAYRQIAPFLLYYEASKLASRCPCRRDQILIYPFRFCGLALARPTEPREPRRSKSVTALFTRGFFCRKRAWTATPAAPAPAPAPGAQVVAWRCMQHGVVVRATSDRRPAGRYALAICIHGSLPSLPPAAHHASHSHRTLDIDTVVL